MGAWWARLCAVASSLSVASFAAADLGPTFVVNTYTTGIQAQPTLLRRPDGSYVAIWRSDEQDGDAGGIFARVVDDDGGEIVPEFRVNVTATGDQREPHAAITPTGEFVVTWTSGALAEGALVARAFGTDAAPSSGELPLADNAFGSSVGLDAEGNIVVSYYDTGSIVVARFSPEGVSSAEPLVLASDEKGQRPSVNATPGGEFVVAWSHETYTEPDPYSGGYYSRNSYIELAPFDASGTELTRQATGHGNESFRPDVAANDAGFVVVWSGCNSDPGEYQARPCYDSHVAAQTFAVDGTPTSEALGVSGYLEGYADINGFDATLHDSGRFTVVWNGPTVSNVPSGVSARQFKPGGGSSGNAVLADDGELDGSGAGVSVANGDGDSVLAAWENAGDIVARRAGGFEFCEEDECRSWLPGEGRFRLRRATADKPAAMKWVWLGEASARTCLVDGAVAELSSAAIRFFDQSGQPSTFYALLDAPVCGSPPCWRFGKYAVVYEDTTGSQDGINLVRFRVGPQGRARIVVRVSGQNMPEFHLPIVMPLSVIFTGGPNTPVSGISFCTAAAFDQAKHNGPQRFLAVGAMEPPAAIAR
jgi:hypothetical protein